MAHGLLKDCVCLLGMFDVYFQDVRFAHRALTRPLGTTTSKHMASFTMGDNLVAEQPVTRGRLKQVEYSR